MVPPVDPEENSKQIVSDDEIAAIARTVGWTGQDIVIAVAVAIAESQGDRTAVGRYVPSRPDYGLWQVNYIHQPEFVDFFPPGTGWKVALNNGYKAKKVWDSQGWLVGWTTYKTGAFAAYLTRAQTAAAKGGTVPPIVNPDGPNETTTVIGGKIPDLVGGLFDGLGPALWIAGGAVLVILGVVLLAKDTDIGKAAIGVASKAAIA